MIKYVKGDATAPIKTDHKCRIIAHICNDIGLWGKGFVMALSKKWKEPENNYRAWFKNFLKYLPLGEFQLIPVTDKSGDLLIMNIIGQHKVQSKNYMPVRYSAIHKAFKNLYGQINTDETIIHMPRIGCGLAGGRWEEIEYILNETLPDVQIYVYDFD